MRYDAWLSRGDRERRIVLEMEAKQKDDQFLYEGEVYIVTSIQPGKGEFDAVLLADLIGDAPRRPN